MSPTIVSAMRAGRTGEAVDEFIRKYTFRISSKVLVPEAREWLGDRVRSAIVDEVARQPADDPARSFFLFLVANDQRRHSDEHFEGILDHRVELHFPFFDAHFLESALAVPVDDGLGHAFCMRWFNELPPEIRSVPWQTYPGHVPYPLPVPLKLRYQWDGADKAEARTRQRNEFREGKQVLINRFPFAVFRKPRLLARLILHGTRIRDVGGVARLIA